MQGGKTARGSVVFLIYSVERKIFERLREKNELVCRCQGKFLPSTTYSVRNGTEGLSGCLSLAVQRENLPCH